MGSCYSLVNVTRREVLSFAHVGANKAGELTRDPAAAAIVVRYLLQHRGDHISFVGDDPPEWPFAIGQSGDECAYREVTDEVVDDLIRAGVLVDRGLRYVDPDDPDQSFLRDLRHAATLRGESQPDAGATRGSDAVRTAAMDRREDVTHWPRWRAVIGAFAWAAFAVQCARLLDYANDYDADSHSIDSANDLVYARWLIGIAAVAACAATILTVRTWHSASPRMAWIATAHGVFGLWLLARDVARPIVHVPDCDPVPLLLLAIGLLVAASWPQRRRRTRS